MHQYFGPKSSVIRINRYKMLCPLFLPEEALNLYLVFRSLLVIFFNNFFFVLFWIFCNILYIIWSLCHLSDFHGVRIPTLITLACSKFCFWFVIGCSTICFINSCDSSDSLAESSIIMPVFITAEMGNREGRWQSSW